MSSDQSRPVPPPLPAERKRPTDAQLWAMVIGGIILFLVALVAIKAAPNILGRLTGMSTAEVEATVKAGIEKDLGVQVSRVSLVREPGNRYTGFANTNEGQLQVEATADGRTVVWKITPMNRRL